MSSAGCASRRMYKRVFEESFTAQDASITVQFTMIRIDIGHIVPKWKVA
jgi:hypothetical protein